MIVVTGATGQLGSQIVRQLIERLPPEQVGVSVRDVDRAADLAALGVRVRHGDFTDPATLAHAFEGASQVLVVSSDTHAGDAVTQHTAALDAARAAGAGRVLYTSHQGAGPDSLFAPMRDHAATEAHLAGLGMPFTSLHNGFYASTVPFLLGPALATGEIRAPADGPVSWTTHADLAAVAAAVLAGDLTSNGFDGSTPPLTAAAAYDLDAVARILTDLTGRTVRRTVVDDEDYTRGLVANGMPEGAAAMMLGIYLASRRGEFAATDPTLERVLGRPAESIETVLDRVVAGTGAAREGALP
ncbi:NAD(P)H-binding protein [Lapillicoccus sp.]|uniref:NAD(P)H-binding protein n=1 Tax=Lapillicoccus sp. TaxID=1909287 RepID=UPI0025CC7819|nr:NAD(P)H-binding protein [Lapillicoccus sp.]